MSIDFKRFATRESELGKTEMSRMDKLIAGFSRRNLMARVGLGAGAAAFLSTMGPIGAALVSGKAQAQTAITDFDILNFALNLEYLEAEYYLRGVTGQGLPASMTTGTGTPGGVNGGTLVPFQNPYLFEIAAKISTDEQTHVSFLRTVLGSSAIARPLIDISGAFQAMAVTAGAIAPGQIFNPFADEISFFIGAFALEEVGVTAYGGAAALIASPAYLSAAASILAVEAYHAGSIRGVLTQASVGQNQGLTVAASDVMSGAKAPFVTQAIATAMSQVSNANTAAGITFPANQSARISATDANSLAFQRTTTQVLNIVQGGPNHAGGDFFPNGLNGTIR